MERYKAAADEYGRLMSHARKAAAERFDTLDPTAAAERARVQLPPHRPAARWAQGIRLAVDVALEAYRGFAADGDVDGIMDAWGARAASLAASMGYFVDQVAHRARQAVDVL